MHRPPASSADQSWSPWLQGIFNTPLSSSSGGGFLLGEAEGCRTIQQFISR
ncbi:hypothetical protein SynBIOSU31_00461 [Synechococcus sp. BIOS-U3-1]|nr:hypothetical protein SynBIOSU31_00461 [Synechococcus sp. BIOS-U3-1]